MGPTSTSKHIEVAMKFSDAKGMVFAFDNPRTAQYKYLRGWNCSWISRFKEEDERLFFGGFYRIKLTMLKLVETNENFSHFVNAIWYLDAVITGAQLYRISTRKSHFHFIKNMFDLILQRKASAEYPSYIIDTFYAFRQNKKQLIFDLYALRKCEVRMRDLLFHA